MCSSRHVKGESIKMKHDQLKPNYRQAFDISIYIFFFLPGLKVGELILTKGPCPPVHPWTSSSKKATRFCMYLYFKCVKTFFTFCFRPSSLWALFKGPVFIPIRKIYHCLLLWTPNTLRLGTWTLSVSEVPFTKINTFCSDAFNEI